MPTDYLSTMGQDIGIVRMLESDYPGRTLAVIPLGGHPKIPPGAAAGPDPDYRKFDGALKTQVRPVLVSLQRLPFRDFRAAGQYFIAAAPLDAGAFFREVL